MKKLEDHLHDQVKDIEKKASDAGELALSGSNRSDLNAKSLGALHAQVQSLDDARESDLRMIKRGAEAAVAEQVAKVHEAVIGLTKQQQVSEAKFQTKLAEHLLSAETENQSLMQAIKELRDSGSKSSSYFRDNNERIVQIEARIADIVHE